MNSKILVVFGVAVVLLSVSALSSAQEAEKAVIGPCSTLKCGNPECPEGVSTITLKDKNGCDQCSYCPPTDCVPVNCFAPVICANGATPIPQLDSRGCPVDCPVCPFNPLTCSRIQCLKVVCKDGVAPVTNPDPTQCPGCPKCPPGYPECPKVNCLTVVCPEGVESVRTPNLNGCSGCPQCPVTPGQA